MTGLVLLIVIALIVYALVSGVASLRAARRAEHVALVDSIRSRFAVPRHQLSVLASQGKLDVSSATFTVLWDLTSHYVRHPWNYAQEGDMLRWSRIAESEDDGPETLPPLARESLGWSRPIRVLVEQIALAMDYLQNHAPATSRFDRWLAANVPQSERAQRRWAALFADERELAAAARRLHHMSARETRRGETPTQSVALSG
jgi:hypothetical protein